MGNNSFLKSAAVHSCSIRGVPVGVGVVGGGGCSAAWYLARAPPVNIHKHRPAQDEYKSMDGSFPIHLAASPWDTPGKHFPVLGVTTDTYLYRCSQLSLPLYPLPDHWMQNTNAKFRTQQAIKHHKEKKQKQGDRWQFLGYIGVSGEPFSF